MAWNIDKAHSEVGFAIKHMMISTVRGKFSRFDAQVDLDPEKLESATVAAQIETASIDTSEEKRDGHLRSADFFDAEKFPTMNFRSTQVTRSGGSVQIAGKLQIRGVESDVVLSGDVEGPTKDPWGNQRLGFSLSAEIEREKWGLGWNQVLESGGVLVAKKAKLVLEIELVQSA